MLAEKACGPVTSHRGFASIHCIRETMVFQTFGLHVDKEDSYTPHADTMFDVGNLSPAGHLDASRALPCYQLHGSDFHTAGRTRKLYLPLLLLAIDLFKPFAWTIVAAPRNTKETRYLLAVVLREDTCYD